MDVVRDIELVNSSLPKYSPMPKSANLGKNI